MDNILTSIIAHMLILWKPKDTINITYQKNHRPLQKQKNNLITLLSIIQNMFSLVTNVLNDLHSKLF
jgi:hypothetical protein